MSILYVNPADVDKSEIKAALQEIQDLPTPISDWEIETGLDSTNDPAVWVYVILERDDVDFDTMSQIRPIVKRTVADITGPPYWTYIRFRTAREVEELKRMK